ncbi:hypothetical protein RUND412_008944 [Rhizina undulata]
MSFPKLPFLYPQFLRKHIVPSNFNSVSKLLPPSSRRLSNASSEPTILSSRSQIRYRHGTAVEPSALPGGAETESPKSKNEDPNTISNDGIASPFDGNQASSAPSKPSEIGEASPNISPENTTHHFDTFNMVKSLENSGFSKGQSVAVMNGVRGLLTQNFQVAKETLVNKSNVENESYLFHAACSELRSEIQNARKTQLESLRAERTRIQQEFDSLNQRFLEDIMNLKDELNNLFNDRKMVTRAEQRAMENKIQELNYKITILINSDLKSEIEKLRWNTTRRGLIAIGILAIFVVTSIRFSRNEHDVKREKKTKEKVKDYDTKVNAGSKDELQISANGHLAESLVNSSAVGTGTSFVTLG